MGVTADNFSAVKTQSGLPGKLYAGVAIPAANAHIKLASDGTPDSVENPSCVHIGITEKGVKFTGKATTQKFYGDEFVFPLNEVVTVVDASFAGSFLQIEDFDVLAAMTKGIGTRNDGAGFQKLDIGTPATLTYQSVALIFPLLEDPTRFGIYHLYKAFQSAGFDFDISKKAQAASPFVFEGLGLTTRAATDVIGYCAKQLQVSS